MEQPGEAGQAARDRLKRLMAANPGAFSAEMKEKLRESEPSNIKRQEEAEKKGAADRKSVEAMDKVREEDRKKVRKDIDERIAREKSGRIQSLEDERTKVQDAQKAFDEEIWQQRRNQSHKTQIIEGARGGIDLYQRAAGGDDARKIAEKAHAQRIITNEKLKSIDEQLKKERRLVVPH